MKIITENNIKDEIMEFWRNGSEPPMSLGMGDFNEFYGLKLGTVTDITGYPYSGKTLLLKEVLVNAYLKHRVKNMLYLPDDGDRKEIISNLIHKLSGKTFDKKYPNNLTENEVFRFLSQVVNDFVIVDDEEESPTPEEFWKKSIELKCQTASIDSWNVMSHSGSGTDYLAKTLSKRNRLAQRNNVHFFTVIHPKNPTGINYDKKTGELNEPSVFDLMGGSEWNNNAKNILVTHTRKRESLEYEIHIKKTKPRIVGMTGMVKMNFCIPSQRFYQEGMKKDYFYDNNFKESENKMIPNTEFDVEPNEAPF